MFLMRLIRKSIAADPSRKEIWVRRWALILTLFVAGVAIAVDLITLLTTFLSGEALTTAFLLKVLVILPCRGGSLYAFQRRPERDTGMRSPCASARWKRA